MRCPYCGSRKLVFDERLGIIVCSECGSVISDQVYDETQTQTKNTIIFNYNKNKIININQIKYYFNKKDNINQNISKIYDKLLDVLAKTRVQNKTLIALSYYIYFKNIGYSKKKSIIKASKKTGVSVKTLEKAVQRYRLLISQIAERVAQSEQRTHVSLRGSKANPRANI